MRVRRADSSVLTSSFKSAVSNWPPISKLSQSSLRDPSALETRNGATQQQIGNKRQQKGDQRRLAGIERAEFDILIDRVHDDSKQHDSCRRDHPLVEATGALAGDVHDRPEIRRGPIAGG